MIVVDAGVVVGLLVGDLATATLGAEECGAPHLIDSEVTNALRRLVLRGDLTDRQGNAAFREFLALAVSRYPAEPLRTRMWELRHNLSAYDATYVALAEALTATTLLTTDAGLANAPGLRCRVTLV